MLFYTEPTYTIPHADGYCVVKKDGITMTHRSCKCGVPKKTCKDLCNKDNDCRGYSYTDEAFPSCSNCIYYTENSSCGNTAACIKIDGKIVGKIMEKENASSGHKGCLIKQKRNNYPLKLSLRESV